MSRVQAAGNPYRAEPCKARSGRTCTRIAGPSASSKNGDFPLNCIGNPHGQFGFALAIECGEAASSPIGLCRAQQNRRLGASAPRRWVAVWVPCLSDDIFEELNMVSTWNGNFPRTDEPQFSVSAGPSTAEARPCGLHDRKRGLRLWR